MKSTSSAFGRLLTVIGLMLVALVSTGAAALPDMSATQRVIADFEMDAGELDAIGAAAAAVDAVVFVSSDLSAYGDTDLVLKDIEKRWGDVPAENVLVMDVSTNTLWSSDVSRAPTYCAAGATAADCLSAMFDQGNLSDHVLQHGMLGIFTFFYDQLGSSLTLLLGLGMICIIGCVVTGHVR